MSRIIGYYSKQAKEFSPFIERELAKMPFRIQFDTFVKQAGYLSAGFAGIEDLSLIHI